MNINASQPEKEKEMNATETKYVVDAAIPGGRTYYAVLETHNALVAWCSARGFAMTVPEQGQSEYDLHVCDAIHRHECSDACWTKGGHWTRIGSAIAYSQILS